MNNAAQFDAAHRDARAIAAEVDSFESSWRYNNKIGTYVFGDYCEALGFAEQVGRLSGPEAEPRKLEALAVVFEEGCGSHGVRVLFS